MTHYTITEDQLHVYLRGEIEIGKMRQLFAEIEADPKFHCNLHQFWHTRECDCQALTSNTLVNLARSTRSNVPKPSAVVAFIAESDLHFGLCRVYGSWADEEARSLGVFRNEEAAKRWVEDLRVERQAV